MIAKSQVIAALTPWLGSEMTLLLDGQMEKITGLLNGWSPRQELAPLAQRIDSLLFLAVREETRGRFLIRLADESWVRVTLEDFAAMADDALYPLFCDMPLDAESLLILREYSMTSASLSALRAQYLRFASMQTPQELAAIASFVKKCYPAARWRSWLA